MALPFDQSVMKTVMRMMIQEEGDHYTFYGKTCTRLTDMGLGWFIGFNNIEHGSYIFAPMFDSGTKAKNITVKHGLITS